MGSLSCNVSWLQFIEKSSTLFNVLFTQRKAESNTSVWSVKLNLNYFSELLSGLLSTNVNFIYA